MDAQELAALITHHDRKYWKEHSPEISDSEYDELFEQLRCLSPNHPLLSKVHGEGGKVKLPEPMLSLAKVYDVVSLVKWIQAVSRTPNEMFNFTRKYDGVSAYFDGERLFSRGDGYLGEDWSSKIWCLRFPANLRLPVRGEIVMSFQDFAENGRGFKSPRSAVAGIMNRKELPENLPKILYFFPHSTNTQTFSCSAALSFLEGFNDSLSQENFPWPCDGIVVSLSDKDYGESLGSTEHHPRHSMAMKFQNPEAITKLLRVEWQVGKRKLTPVAILEPVKISGFTNDRASLHNLAHIHRLGLKEGAIIVLERAGDIIPQIKSAAGGKGAIPIPETCPACGHPTAIQDDQDLYCTNDACAGKAAVRLRSAAERLGLEEIGPIVASNLVNAGYRTIPELMAADVIDLAYVKPFGTASALKLHARLERLNTEPVEDFRILASMCFEGVGLTMAKKICDKFSLGELAYVDLTSIEGVGEATARACDFACLEWCDALLCFNIKTTKGSSSNPTICFTGKSDIPRDVWITRAEKGGYVFISAVTKGLTLLVTGDTNSSSSKAVKARKYGTKLMTYEEFQNLLDKENR